MTTPAFNLVISELSKVDNPTAKIIGNSAYWIPLQWVYVEMIKNRDLVRLSELPKEQKEKYWRMVVNINAPPWKKINIAQSLYVYEKINQL